jgi:hypothetical protein
MKELWNLTLVKEYASERTRISPKRYGIREWDITQASAYALKRIWKDLEDN